MVVVSGFAVVAEIVGRTEFANVSPSLSLANISCFSSPLLSDASLAESVHDQERTPPSSCDSSVITAGILVVPGVGVVDDWKPTGLPITKPSILMVERLVVVLTVVDVVVVDSVVVFLLDMNGL